MNAFTMDSQAAENLLAGSALFFSLLSLCISILAYRRENRVEKSAAYLQLEMNSSEVFKYEAEFAEIMAPLLLRRRPRALPKGDAFCKAREAARNLYFQSLNLFEVCARFRKQQVIAPEVFASWVAWFHDLLQGWHFRETWPEIRGNYTPDVRDIFDVGREIFEAGLTPEETMIAFYAAVGDIMACERIGGWLGELDQIRAWRPTP